MLLKVCVSSIDMTRDKLGLTHDRGFRASKVCEKNVVGVAGAELGAVRASEASIEASVVR